MFNFIKKIVKSNTAQTAIEISVFGAILIFLIGSIVHQAVGYSFAQNQRLKVFRMALSLSLLHGRSDMTLHNNASVLIIEDRLSLDSAKYGAVERVPNIAQGSGTHTSNFFMPTDPGTFNNMGVMDIFVNGQHFPLTVQGMKRIQLVKAGANVKDGAEAIDISGSNLQLIDKNNSNSNYAPGEHVVKMAEKGVNMWLERCAYSGGDTNSTIPCAVFFTVVPNNPVIKKWCSSDCDLRSTANQFPADARFDLDRSGLDRTGVESTEFELFPDPDVAENLRPVFSWQWDIIVGMNGRTGVRNSSFFQGEGIVVSDTESVNAAVDIDGDMLEETIIHVQADGAGVITGMTYIDGGEGDISFTGDSEPGKPTPGLQDDMQMWSFVKERVEGVSEKGEGTYLLIEEGKLYSTDKQYHRSIQKKDKIDIIQRILQLSNNTGRFCRCEDGSTKTGCTIDENPVGSSASNNYYPNLTYTEEEWNNSSNKFSSVPIWGIPYGGYGGVDVSENPVKACCVDSKCCFTKENMTKTCMVIPDEEKYGPPYILIRSAIEDKKGRKWITPMDEDDYVDLTP